MEPFTVDDINEVIVVRVVGGFRKIILEVIEPVTGIISGPG